MQVMNNNNNNLVNEFVLGDKNKNNLLTMLSPASFELWPHSPQQGVQFS